MNPEKRPSPLDLKVSDLTLRHIVRLLVIAAKVGIAVGATILVATLVNVHFG